MPRYGPRCPGQRDGERPEPQPTSISVDRSPRPKKPQHVCFDLSVRLELTADGELHRRGPGAAGLRLLCPTGDMLRRSSLLVTLRRTSGRWVNIAQPPVRAI